MSERARPLAEMVAAAAARIERLEPVDALAAVEAGAVLVDIRADERRRRDGIVPGAVHIPRSVLEWRLAPDSEWRNPHVSGVERQVVLICDDGYSSILAAAGLVDLGYAQAGDVVGGYAAWRRAGLPTSSFSPDGRDPGALAGMGGPEG